MYASLRSWMNVPLTVRPFVKHSGAGTKQFGDNVELLCYPKADIQVITDEKGSEVISTTQLYVDGRNSIKVTDNVIFEGTERPIQRINTFYRNGAADILVVYL